MNGLDLLADTNALIYFLSGDKRVWDIITKNSIHISFITEIELLSKNQITKKEEKTIIELIDTCTVLPYNDHLKNTSFN